MRGIVATAAVWAILGTVGRVAPGSRASSDRKACPIPIQLFEKRLGQRGVELVEQEVQAVWAPHGITIVWTPNRVESRLLVVIDRPDSPLPGACLDAGWNVAVVRYVDGHVVAPVYASVDAAERVARAACPPYSSPALSGLVVPRVLGRAIAHELAHVFLDTREHSSTGLLRRRFSADEFTSPVRDPFFLGPDDRLRLGQRW